MRSAKAALAVISSIFQSNLIGLNIFSVDILPANNIATIITKYRPSTEDQLVSSYSRGNSYLITGDFEDALAEFNQAIDIRPTVPDLFISRGIVNEKLLRWNDAISDYKKANALEKGKLFE